MDDAEVKPVIWVGSAYKDLTQLPKQAQRTIGYALFLAQAGQKHVRAKPLKGFGGAGILEIVEVHDGDAYRAVYTVRLAGNIYVLHVFQKKSNQGISTPQQDIDLIRERLKAAQSIHQERTANRKAEAQNGRKS